MRAGLGGGLGLSEAVEVDEREEAEWKLGRASRRSVLKVSKPSPSPKSRVIFSSSGVKGEVICIDAALFELGVRILPFDTFVGTELSERDRIAAMELRFFTPGDRPRLMVDGGVADGAEAKRVEDRDMRLDLRLITGLGVGVSSCGELALASYSIGS